MQKILYVDEAESYADSIDLKVISYLRGDFTETFESHKNFSLFAFPVYNIHKPGFPVNEIMIYLDHEDLFFLCENRSGYEYLCSLVTKEETNEQALWHFFQNLLKHDMDNLDDLECEVADAEMSAMVRFDDDYIYKIISYRKALLRLKRYYEQLDAVLDNLVLNENHMLTDSGVRRFTILSNRTARYLSNVLNLRDYVTQMREAYQSQIDIEQNNLMRLFTVITAIFQPLTLLVGWYGMNFSSMPEMGWKYAYPVFITASALICVCMLVYFKKKKWV